MSHQFVRSTKNMFKGYSPTQVLVRDATANNDSGTSIDVLDQLGEMSYDTHEFRDIFSVLDRRISDKPKYWRHVAKSLTVVDYLVRFGSEACVQWARDNARQLEILRDFYYSDSAGIDQGQLIRVKAAELIDLLRDPERLATERGMNMRGRRNALPPRRMGPHRRPSMPRRPEDEEDVDRALEESKKTAEEDEARRRKDQEREKQDLKEAVKLSKEEDELKRLQDEANNKPQYFDENGNPISQEEWLLREAQREEQQRLLEEQQRIAQQQALWLEQQRQAEMIALAQQQAALQQQYEQAMIAQQQAALAQQYEQTALAQQQYEQAALAQQQYEQQAMLAQQQYEQQQAALAQQQYEQQRYEQQLHEQQQLFEQQMAEQQESRPESGSNNPFALEKEEQDSGSNNPFSLTNYNTGTTTTTAAAATTAKYDSPQTSPVSPNEGLNLINANSNFTHMPMEEEGRSVSASTNAYSNGNAYTNASYVHGTNTSYLTQNTLPTASTYQSSYSTGHEFTSSNINSSPLQNSKYVLHDHDHDFVSRDSELVSRNSELVSHDQELLSHNNELSSQDDPFSNMHTLLPTNNNTNPSPSSSPLQPMHTGNSVISAKYSNLNQLLAQGTGIDTFGNEGATRIPAQHTKTGTFINSQGTGYKQVTSSSSPIPLLPTQYTGLPAQTAVHVPSPSPLQPSEKEHQTQQTQGFTLVDL